MPRLHLPIHDPCHENWDAMDRDGDGRRFCEVCTQHVHDLSSMTERAARGVLAERTAKGRVCVRYTADAAGNIKFKPETVEASSMWRMTLAAAGVALALLSGCADSEPDRVVEDRCVYEVGPWSFTAERGQGTCPAVEDEDEDEDMVMGELDAVIESPPEPVHEVKGDIGRPLEPTMGEAPMVEPPPPSEHKLMGAMRGPVIDEPCDPVPEAPADDPAPADPTQPERDGPRRL